MHMSGAYNRLKLLQFMSDVIYIAKNLLIDLNRNFTTYFFKF